MSPHRILCILSSLARNQDSREYAKNAYSSIYFQLFYFIIPELHIIYLTANRPFFHHIFQQNLIAFILIKNFCLLYQKLSSFQQITRAESKHEKLIPILQLKLRVILFLLCNSKRIQIKNVLPINHLCVYIINIQMDNEQQTEQQNYQQTPSYDPQSNPPTNQANNFQSYEQQYQYYYPPQPPNYVHPFYGPPHHLFEGHQDNGFNHWHPYFHHAVHQNHFFEGKGMCKGRGKGHYWKKFCQKHKKQKKCQEKFSSSEESGSDDEEQMKQLEKNFNKMEIKDKKMKKQTILKEFQESLGAYFDSLKTGQEDKKRITKFLMKRYESSKDLSPLIETINQLSKQSPHFFYDMCNLSFLKIIKEIIKQGFQIKHINARLDKVLFIKAKKHQKDQEYMKNHQKQPAIEFLTEDQLSQLDLSQTLFLVDGNNIMPKQKIFRKFYESPLKEEQAEGQVRLHWLFAQTLQAQLFFDTRHEDNLYQRIKQSIMSKEEEEKGDKIPLIFADKHLRTDATADEKIIERIKQIGEKKQYQGRLLILVSADRELCHLCRQHGYLKKTSGKYIFKFCKQMLRVLNYNHPQRKGIIKRIFSY